MADESSATGLQVSVLGPPSATQDGASIDLGGPKPRLLLSLLIAARDHAVSVEALIDGLWGDDPPPTARKSVQVQVSNLRRALGENAPLKTTPGGYVFQSSGVEVDVADFEAEVERASSLIRADPPVATALLTQGLARWRGPAYGDLEAEPALSAEVARLSELRLRAIELRIEAQLRHGRHHEVVGELETLIADHPYRERFRAQHMLALYRCGRQADALRSFTRARETLADDLGIEPSAMLRDLERQILEQSSDIGEPALAEASVACLVTKVLDGEELWEHDPAAMAGALERLDRVVGDVVGAAGGRVAERNGASSVSVFSACHDAACAATNLQMRVSEIAWSTPRPLRIRAAIDVGAVEERAGRMAGHPIARAARLAAAGHGGQVLVSSAAAESVDATLRSVGTLELGELGRTEVHQLVGDGLDVEFPPLRTSPRVSGPRRTGFPLAIRGYELREQLGSSDASVVYRAYQASVGREVAVKVIRPEYANDPAFVRRFEAEAQFVARLEHPHIVSLFDYWRDPDGGYLVMNFLRGGTVAHELERATYRPPVALRLVDQVGSALAYAHRHGVVHGDIKPQNVLLDDDGNAYLSDFGIAHHHVDSIGTPTATSVAYLAPEEIAGEPGDVRSDIYCLSLFTYELLTGRRPELGGQPEPLDGFRHDVRAEVGAVIARGAAADRAQRYERVEDFVRALRIAFGADVVTTDHGPLDGEVRNPFKGLRAFTEVDAKDFHGRESLVDELLAMIRTHGFVAAVGPSGTGKSSVVRAGVLPAVRDGALGTHGDWVVATMFPGSFPFEELESTLLRVAVERPDGLLEDLTSDDRGLLRVSKQILPDDGTSLLLVIDQFEELFSLVADDEARVRFLDSLVTACSDERSRVRVLATMRADFFDRPLVHAEFGALLKQGLVTVAMPSDENLAVAISRPARDAGLDLEVGLIPTIVQHVAGQPGGLPLLQYVLTELVERRRGRTLTLADYRAMGGALGALGRRAEEIYEGLGERAQIAAKELCLRLVTVAEDGDDTRRRVRRSELAALPIEHAAMDAAIEQFGTFRLLSFDHDPVTRGPTIEVAHEALTGEWPRYARWVDEHRDDLLHERRVEELAREWDAHGCDPSYLLRGGRLAQYRAWAERTRIRPSALVRDLLDASESAAVDEEHQAIAQRRRDRRLRRNSRLLVGAAIGIVVLVALAGFAIVSRNDANEQRQRAEQLAAELAATDRARGLATAAIGQLDLDPRLSVSLAVASAQVTAPLGFVEPQTLDALHFGLQRARVTFPVDESTPVAVRPSTDGSQGIFMMPVDDVLELARRHARPLIDADCGTFFPGTTCPTPSEPFSSGIEVRGGVDAYLSFTNEDRPLLGTTFTLLTTRGDVDRVELENILQSAADRLGVDVRTQFVEAGVLGRSDGFDGVDAVESPQPGAVRSAVMRSELVDLTPIIDGPELERRFGAELAAYSRLDGAPVDSAVYSVPLNVDNKSILWYSKPVFDEHGYAMPGTWDDLIALSDRMVTDGVAPWCWSGATLTDGGGFPVTDWVENIVLRGSGPDVYMAWARGEIRFESEPIRAAFERLGSLVFPDGYTAEGAELVPLNSFWSSWFDLASPSPSCAMHVGPNWVLEVVQVPASLRSNVGAIAFPVIDPAYGDAMVGGGNSLSLTMDTPEARAVVAYTLTHDFYRERALRDRAFIAPDPTFEPPASTPAEQAEVIDLTHNALRTGGYVFDAADLMPPAVGGQFYFEPNDWFAYGPGHLDELLRRLDDSWPARRPDDTPVVPRLTGAPIAFDAGTYRLDLSDASIVTEIPAGLALTWSVPGLVALVNGPDESFGLVVTRPNGLKTRSESQDPDPALASIDSRDIDRWLDELPVIVLDDRRLDVGGRPTRVLDLTTDPNSDLGSEVCEPVDVPCFHAHGHPPGPDLVPIPVTARYERRIWIVDPVVGDPIWIWAFALPGDDWIDVVTPLVEAARVDLGG